MNNNIQPLYRANSGHPGNSGLGKETILQLAKHNPARIYLAARTESKALDAIKFIQDELSKSSTSSATVDIQYIPLDLASFSSIKAAAEHFNRNNSRLDILVLNAGVMAEPAVTTLDGYEVQLGTNHVGHFLLTKLLLPTLLTTTKNQPDADVRVISVSSAANAIAPANESLYEAMTSTEKLLELSTWQRYGISKAANILFASELARRYPAIKSVALHPGIVSTQLYDGTRETNQTAKYGLSVAMSLAFRSPKSGALNQLWAAAGARKDELVNGGYYTPIGLRLVHNRFMEDEELAKNFWDWMESDISKKLGAL